MFGKPNGIIRKRIMEVIEEKIEIAENDYYDDCKDIEARYIESVTLLNEQVKSDKNKVADDLVNDILGKIT